MGEKIKVIDSFFITTPSLNALQWLPVCVASIAVQVGPNIRVHHHVQDGGSNDGTIAWLQNYEQYIGGRVNYSFSWDSEQDTGMYDAVNRGWDLADVSWDWLAYLNCDEQYQPGTFDRVSQAGIAHPQWGAITGNCVWVDKEGHYLCSRKPSIGWSLVGRVWIPAATCALFVRRPFFAEKAVRLNSAWRSFGDKLWTRDLLNAGCRFGYVDDYMAIFIHRGDNLGFQPVSTKERERYWDECLAPWERRFAPLAIFAAKTSRVMRNLFGRRCREYAFYKPNGDVRYVTVPRNRWTVPS